MTAQSSDPAQRFSDRVDHYVRSRPGYPAVVMLTLVADAGLSPASVVADIGSGTGISSELFLRLGATVYGVEPNAAMRSAAESDLCGYANFHSVNGRAEATTLPDDSVDFVVAGQAFHWFDVTSARREFARILRPNGWLALIWNTRRTDTSPFLRDYEDLLLRFGTDYRQVDHRNVPDAAIRSMFAPESYQARTFVNEQLVDFEGLKGRLLSSSYVPAEGQPNHTPMLAELKRIFVETQESGHVCFEYDTELYFGLMARERC